MFFGYSAYKIYVMNFLVHVKNAPHHIYLWVREYNTKKEQFSFQQKKLREKAIFGTTKKLRFIGEKNVTLPYIEIPPIRDNLFFS